MRYYAYSAAIAGMVAVAATAVSWAQTATSGNTQAGMAIAAAPASGAAPSASAAAVPAAPSQATATSPAKPQELASSPACPPAPVHRHVAYHHRVHSTVGSQTYIASYGRYSSVGGYGAEYAVAVAPPPPPVYYAPPPVIPVWYRPGPRPWFGGPWHHWWHQPWR
jgi:hypothetical protein